MKAERLQPISIITRVCLALHKKPQKFVLSFGERLIYFTVASVTQKKRTSETGENRLATWCPSASASTVSHLGIAARFES